MDIAGKSYPPRIDLARLPTPLQPLERWSEKIGVDLMIKRDDLTGAVLSGNKIRKLEFLLADAREERSGYRSHLRRRAIQSLPRHCDCGAFGGNSTACCSCARRIRKPRHPPTGNILLDRVVGAEVRWITPAQYGDRHASWKTRPNSSARRVALPTSFPRAAPTPLAAGATSAPPKSWPETSPRSPPSAPPPSHACGSGGTGAGLHRGKKLTDLVGST